MTKWVYTFGGGEAEGNAGDRDLLGGKGANQAVAAQLAGARALAQVAEENNDAALAAWAHGVVATLDTGDERARAASDR